MDSSVLCCGCGIGSSKLAIQWSCTQRRDGIACFWRGESEERVQHRALVNCTLSCPIRQPFTAA